MAKKVALLVGVGDYGEGLKPLRCPVKGVEAMEAVLANPEIGGFDEVVPLVNPDVGEMRSRMGSLFASLSKDDLVLFYFTGHGIKDMNGKFYLSTTQTELFVNGRVNSGTAVEADFLRSVVGDCLALRKVVILDCCFGAAFADGFMGMDDSSIDVEAQIGAQASDARGWCVLTASTSTQYALEQADEELSVYTRYLVAGLRTGGAAPDGQAHISVGHLHAYVAAQVKEAAPAMDPAIFNAQQGAEIAIAKAVVDNEQRYRKQVQGKVRKGRIRPAARVYLSQWQQQLKLTVEAATAIEEEVLKPFRERQRHVEIYTGALKAEKEDAYPLDDEAVEDLKDLQRLLNLRDEDVWDVEQEILGEQFESARKSQGLDLKVPSVVQKSAQKTVQNAPSQYPTFSFETVRVNEKGNVIETLPGNAKYYSEDLGDGVTLDMVRIPEGTFLMGAAEGEAEAQDREYPQHEVTVPEFWMGKSAITQAQWKAVAALKKVERELPDNPARFKGAQRPVERVSWEDAVEFCERLSQYSKRAYSLPSEAKWEYACRAGTTTPFYFGPTIMPALVNCNGGESYGNGPVGENRKKTTDVNSFPPNGFGLYDMHGNVLELCSDGLHGSYDKAPVDGSAWASNNKNKVLRGGAWDFLPRNCRSAFRDSISPEGRNFIVGFRVSCSAPRTQ